MVTPEVLQPISMVLSILWIVVVLAEIRSENRQLRRHARENKVWYERLQRQFAA